MIARRAVKLVKDLTAFGALAVIVLAYRAWVHVNTTTVALTLLLYILLVAARLGLWYAVVISLTATGYHNFFFLPPIGTLTISDPQIGSPYSSFSQPAFSGVDSRNRPATRPRMQTLARLR